MPKYPLSFIELHNTFFMQGKNMPQKLNAKTLNAKLLLDDERGGVWIHYAGKTALIPCPSIASMDLVEIPKDVQEALGLQTAEQAPMPVAGPPAIARARRGRPPQQDPEIPQGESIPVPMPTHDPNDAEAAAAHRARVRAASANANRPAAPVAQDDRLIQQARNAAMGIKTHGTAQVMTAEQVGAIATSGVSGKPKNLSHAALKAQGKP